MRNFEFTERAARDFATVREWYDQRSVSLGRRFVEDVVQAIQAARERPESFPLVRNGVRGNRCKKFPYRVYFEALSDRIVLLAIYHTARNPNEWDDPDRE